jgi:hypothetical protein
MNPGTLLQRTILIKNVKPLVSARLTLSGRPLLCAPASSWLGLRLVPPLRAPDEMALTGRGLKGFLSGWVNRPMPWQPWARVMMKDWASSRGEHWHVGPDGEEHFFQWNVGWYTETEMVFELLMSNPSSFWYDSYSFYCCLFHSHDYVSNCPFSFLIFSEGKSIDIDFYHKFLSFQ